MCIALDEFVEDGVITQECVELIAFLLVLIWPQGTNEFGKVLLGNHLLLQVELDELKTEELLYIIDDDMLATQGIQPFA